MNAKLTRPKSGFRQDGVFGRFVLDDGTGFYSLEHAFIQSDGSILPKVCDGTYNVVRHPPNRLPYETFMLENVPDFIGIPVTGILVHILNFNKESDGCIGIGMGVTNPLPTNGKMITSSKEAFQKFMKLQEGLNNFQLIVETTD